MIGCCLLIAAYTFLILRGLIIAYEAPTTFSRLLAGSITMSFFIYALVNMGMVSGILPVVGVPLPFMSYGGTALVTLGLSLGILMSITRSTATDAELTAPADCRPRRPRPAARRPARPGSGS